MYEGNPCVRLLRICTKTNIMESKWIVGLFLVTTLTACQAQEPKDSVRMATGQEHQQSVKYNELTPQQRAVIVNKATDRPFTGDYYQKKDAGIYVCRQCNNPLYRSEDKFDSHCGWPSFDDEIDGAVTRVPDADGERVEIICNNCHGHLGHVFVGEGFTDKDTRHCVNTSSILFYPADKVGQIPLVIR